MTQAYRAAPAVYRACVSNSCRREIHHNPPVSLTAATLPCTGRAFKLNQKAPLCKGSCRGLPRLRGCPVHDAGISCGASRISCHSISRPGGTFRHAFRDSSPKAQNDKQGRVSPPSGVILRAKPEGSLNEKGRKDGRVVMICKRAVERRNLLSTAPMFFYCSGR